MKFNKNAESIEEFAPDVNIEATIQKTKDWVNNGEVKLDEVTYEDKVVFIILGLIETHTKLAAISIVENKVNLMIDKIKKIIEEGLKPQSHVIAIDLLEDEEFVEKYWYTALVGYISECLTITAEAIFSDGMLNSTDDTDTFH